MPTPTARPGIGAAIRRYMSNKPGIDVYVSEMVQDLGFTRSQIQSGVNNRRASGDPIEVIVNGNCWRWSPNGAVPDGTKTPAKEPKRELSPSVNKPAELMMFKVIHVFPDGDALLMDTESHAVWRASPLS